MLLREYPSTAEYQEALGRPASAALVIPVGQRLLADSDTPVSVLSRIIDEPDVFLLESVEGGERWGRYSFLGMSARVSVKVFRDYVLVERGGKAESIPHHGAPLDVLRGISESYRHAEIPGLPRFKGGLVGYFGYEMVSFFETRVKNTLPADKPIAHLMVPEVVLAFDNIQHSLDVMVMAFAEDIGVRVDSAETLLSEARARAQQIVNRLAAPAPAAKPRSSQAFTPQAVIGEEAFRQKVVDLKKHIVAGDIIQCVVSQAFVCEAPTDLLGLYRAQRYINPSPYLYFMKLGGVTLVGSSPETMIRVENRQATLRPIAGTRPRGKSEQEDRALANDLLKDEKEKAEHVMLVDLGRNELGRIAKPGTVQVTDLMIVERYSHVMHLVSNITADLDEQFDAYDVLQASFPAGTLSGAPKVKAMELIAQFEDRPRGNYGGAVGYLSFDGQMDFAICIRTAIIENGQLVLQAGAGIVADSDPESERMETVNKARSVARALEMIGR